MIFHLQIHTSRQLLPYLLNADPGHKCKGMCFGGKVKECRAMVPVIGLVKAQMNPRM